MQDIVMFLKQWGLDPNDKRASIPASKYYEMHAEAMRKCEAMGRTIFILTSGDYDDEPDDFEPSEYRLEGTVSPKKCRDMYTRMYGYHMNYLSKQN